MRGNFTYARNMIVDQDQPDYKYLYMNRTGQARYQTFGLVAAGLFRDQADIDAWPKQSFGDVEPGDIKYLDLNGDGVVDSYDVKPIGYTNVPEIVYGFGFSLQWKAFDFSAFFQGVGKRDWYPAGESGLFWGQYDRPYGYSLPWQNADRWSEDNPNAYWPLSLIHI